MLNPFLEKIFWEQVHFDAKQGNFVPSDSVYFHCKEFGHVISLCQKQKLFTLIEEENKFIKEQVPKFDDRELVDSKNVLTFKDSVFLYISSNCVIVNLYLHEQAQW